MSIFKDVINGITLINRIKKATKQAKKMIEKNQGFANEIKADLETLKITIESLLRHLPQFKPIYREVIEIVKQIFKN